MSTAETVKAQLNALLNQANNTTGKTDTNLAAAIASLVAGFGQGGSGGGSARGIYMAKVTPETDSNELKIQHNLGTTDILLAAAFAETLGEITPSFNGALAKFWAKTDIPVKETSASSAQNYDAHFLYNTGTTLAVVGSPNSRSYRCIVVDENTFEFKRAGSAVAKYIAGVTYTIIVIAANAEV